MGVFGFRGLIRTGLQIVHGEIENALEAVKEKETQEYQCMLRGREVWVVHWESKNDPNVSNLHVYSCCEHAESNMKQIEKDGLYCATIHRRVIN